jgi:hypothetical protein
MMKETLQLSLYLAEVQRLRMCSLLCDGKIPGQRLSIGETIDYTGPNEDKFATFVLIIRRFISEREGIFIGKVANLLQKLTRETHPDICEQAKTCQDHFKAVMSQPVVVVKSGLPPDLKRILDVNPELRETVWVDIYNQHAQTSAREILRNRKDYVDTYLNGLLFHANMRHRHVFGFLNKVGMSALVALYARETLLACVPPVLNLEVAIRTLFDREPNLSVEENPFVVDDS